MKYCNKKLIEEKYVTIHRVWNFITIKSKPTNQGMLTKIKNKIK